MLGRAVGEERVGVRRLWGGLLVVGLGDGRKRLSVKGTRKEGGEVISINRG